MPIHDWTHVDAGIFHDFHSTWIPLLKQALNQTLPSDYYALSEQLAAFLEPTAVGRELIEMPVFLEQGLCVPLTLESTYQAAWNAVPKYWQNVIGK